MAKIKKAQNGGNEVLVKKKQTPSGSMYKYKSPDDNYVTKIKYKAGQEPTPENPEFRGTLKTRRTLKGLLTGAPKVQKNGGKTDKKWIQKAVNPAHKGYCTPMTKATCTPKRKALAQTFKRMAKARKGK